MSEELRTFEELTTGQVTQLDDGQLQIVVPADCELPEELTSLPPRRIPDDMYRHRRIRVPFVASWVLVGIFVLSVVAGARPFGPPWAQIAFWLVAILGLLGVVGLFTSRRELRYVQDGIVGSGRILELQLVPAVEYNGQTIALQHVVTLALALSDGNLAVREFTGLQIQADGNRQTSLRVGDLLPIVWLPGRFNKTARPYAFLNFNQDSVLIRTTGKASSVWKKIGTGLAVVAIFAVLIGNVLLLMWCVPVSMNVPVVVTIGVVGALLLGGAMLGLIIWDFRRQDRRAIERNQLAIAEGYALQQGSSHAILTNTPKGWIYRILVGLGSLLIGGLTLVMWSFGANQFFDHAPPVERVIEISDVREVGGNSPRTKVTFHPVDDPQAEYSQEYVRRDLPDFPMFAGQRARVEWHPGAFGWPWIGELQPAPLN